jgi:DMSO/TMAO reductase YedYZ molybdopterin-dependent catalytic subunit
MRKRLIILSVLLLFASGCGLVPVAPSPTATTATPIPEEQWGSIIHKHPSQVDNTLLPITPIEDLHTTGRPVEVAIDEHRLVIDGLVERPLSLTYGELLSRPQVSEVVLLICPGFFWDNAQWTGTPLAPLLEEAGLREGAKKVRFHALDGYQRSLSLEEALADGVFLACQVNGESLPPEHGFPLRLVARGQYGGKWVKWLERIEVTE